MLGVRVMDVQWKRGSQFNVEAGVAHTVVEKIRKKNHGTVKPAMIVAEAKKARCPIHKEFEWDDAVAGHEYRLECARKMMRSFVIIRSDVKTDRPQRVYEVVKERASGSGSRPKLAYRSIEDIMADPDLRSELLGRALRELVAIRNRYRDLQELAIVMRSIDEVLETVSV